MELKTQQYLESLQTPSGFADVVQIMVHMMAANSANHEYLGFMQEVGSHLGDRYPLQKSGRLQELCDAINRHLSMFKWGYAEISDHGDSLVITHNSMPCDKQNPALWQQALGALLCGLYNTWFHQSGAPVSLVCRIEQFPSPTCAVLRLKKNG